jgi:hypothetical protein
MAVCHQCGNDYDKAFTVVMAGQEFTFDCFECAIQELAPPCAHCGCKVIGHGMEADGAIFCCAHCAQHAGVAEMQDRV